jgi:putative DNA primase/helicase
MTPLEYIKLGLAVFPCHYAIINGVAQCSCGNPNCPDPAKHPYPRHAPNGFKSASLDPEHIKRWAFGPYNVAVATGAVSKVVVIDVDPRHGGDENLPQLEYEYGSLPQTWRAITGGGGDHFYFRHPGQLIPNSAGRIGVGIDVRGDGGYVLVPRSLHISGRHYEWSVDHHPEWTDLAPLPQWLLDKAAAPETGDREKINWKAFVAQPIVEGSRHHRLVSLAALLFFRLAREPHLAAQLLLAFNQTHCSPPLEEAELLRIIDHAAAREILKRRAQR